MEVVMHAEPFHFGTVAGERVGHTTTGRSIYCKLGGVSCVPGGAVSSRQSAYSLTRTGASEVRILKRTLDLAYYLLRGTTPGCIR